MKKLSGHMALGKLQPKFERNPYIWYRENCATNERTDGQTDKSPIP